MHPTQKTAIREAFKHPESDSRDTFSAESVYMAMIGGALAVSVVLIIILVLVILNARRYKFIFRNSQMITNIPRRVGRTEFYGAKLEGQSLEADCKDSGHFSSEGRTRDCLLEQGRSCRSCGEVGRDNDRGSSCGGQGTYQARINEEECISYEIDEENCDFLMKKCFCCKCEQK